ncbi:MAG: hypothetical protein AAF447_08055 [Myxococcota bacterium]
MAWLRQTAFTMAKVWVLGLVAVFSVGYVVAGRALASVDRELLGLGSSFATYQEVLRTAPVDPEGRPVREPGEDGERFLVFNGQRVRISTGHAPGDVRDFVEGFEAGCDGADGLPDDVSTDSRASRSLIEEDEGYAACLDVGEDELDLEEWKERLEAFQRTGNLEALGSFRYAYASEGSDGETSYVMLQAAGGIDLDSVLPTLGTDVPGPELSALPRPPGATRIMSAYEEREPYLVSMFAGSPETPEELAAHYRTLVDTSVWQEVEVPVEPGEGIGVFFLHRDEPARFAFAHFERSLELDASEREEEEDLQTLTTIMEAR